MRTGSLATKQREAELRWLGGGQRDAGLDGSLRSVNRLEIIPNATH